MSEQPDKTWMIGDKPGQILKLMAECAEQTGIVKRKSSKQVGEHYDVGSMERAVRIWCARGIVAQVWTSDEIVSEAYKNDKGTQIAVARVRYHLRLIAPDGSYVEAQAVGAGSSHGGKHFAMARTDARKELLRGLLQMASEESAVVQDVIADKDSEEDADEVWSDNLRMAVAAIDACANHDELLSVGKIEVFAKLTPAERGRGIVEFRRRVRVVEDLSGRKYADALKAKGRR